MAIWHKAGETLVTQNEGMNDLALSALSQVDTLQSIESPRAEKGTIDGTSASGKQHISIVTAAQNMSGKGHVWHAKTQHTKKPTMSVVLTPIL